MNQYILKLIARPKTETQPQSIAAICARGDENCVIWADASISVNGKDLSNSELLQIMAVKENFFLFYNNIKS